MKSGGDGISVGALVMQRTRLNKRLGLSLVDMRDFSRGWAEGDASYGFEVRARLFRE